MRTVGLANAQSYANALQLLGQPRSSAFSKSGSSSAQTGTASTATTSQSDQTSLSPEASTMALLKKLADSGDYAGAAQGTADDTILKAVKNGTIPQLATLSDSDYSHLTKAEKNLYGVIRSLQGYYEAQPQTSQQALSNYVQTVKETYPDDIARMQTGLADGTLKASDGWNNIIAQEQAELDAARQGKMQIHTVSDSSLVSASGGVTVKGGDSGWSVGGPSVQADIPALQKLYNTKNIVAGSSPYFGNYVITW